MAEDEERPGPAGEAGLPPGTAGDLPGFGLVTDAALSSPGPQALLDRLACTVKTALKADTATVLLLDTASGHLVAAAASGLEEEVRQGVRIPLGHGFAGQIAARAGRRSSIT